ADAIKAPHLALIVQQRQMVHRPDREGGNRTDFFQISDADEIQQRILLAALQRDAVIRSLQIAGYAPALPVLRLIQGKEHRFAALHWITSRCSTRVNLSNRIACLCASLSLHLCTA